MAHTYKYIAFLQQLTTSMPLAWEEFINNRVKDISDLGVEVEALVIRQPMNRGEEAIMKIYATEEEYQIITQLLGQQHKIVTYDNDSEEMNTLFQHL